MPNPFEFISKIELMNDDICERLDRIIERIEELIQVTKENKEDWYGDGK